MNDVIWGCWACWRSKVVGPILAGAGAIGGYDLVAAAADDVIAMRLFSIPMDCAAWDVGWRFLMCSRMRWMDVNEDSQFWQRNGRSPECWKRCRTREFLCRNWTPQMLQEKSFSLLWTWKSWIVLGDMKNIRCVEIQQPFGMKYAAIWDRGCSSSKRCFTTILIWNFGVNLAVHEPLKLTHCKIKYFYWTSYFQWKYVKKSLVTLISKPINSICTAFG